MLRSPSAGMICGRLWSRPLSRLASSAPEYTLLEPATVGDLEHTSNLHRAAVDGHADDGIHAHAIEGFNFCHFANASRRNQLPLSELPQPGADLQRKPLHRPFLVDMRIKKCIA